MTTLTNRERIHALLNNLNEAQADGVTHMNGPLLLLAGPGSGKTRCITNRIGMLLEHGVSPYSILAVTFTNKAAAEMKERVKTLTKGNYALPTICTFHSFCVQLLRRHIPLASPERTTSFSIYDTGDSEKAIRQAIKELGFDPKFWKVGDMRNAISGAKNQGQSPSHPHIFPWLKVEQVRQEALAIYSRYEQVLLANNAVDFDDLLLLALKLVRQNEHIRDILHERYTHVSVDEFQDTNPIQYNLIKLIACGETPPEALPPTFWDDRSIAVVGDDQQGVYGFRKADISIIRSFERQFRATRIDLTINYRSTEPIVAFSNAVIKESPEGYKKTLTSHRGTGNPVAFHNFTSGNEEAKWVARTASQALQTPDTKLAILYRTTAQARLFEESLRQLNIPYTLTGGLSFYDRAEIKDVLAYIQFALNPNDNQTLTRIINTPKRGVGETSIEQLLVAAQIANQSLYQLLSQSEAPPSIKPATWKKAQAAITALNTVRNFFHTLPLSEAILNTLAFIGYFKHLEETQEDWEGRVENVQELVSAAVEFDESESPLSDFIDHSSLNTKTETDSPARVHLMTMHAAKGLEFPHVVVAGVEADFLPHYNSKTLAEYEEERRLFYVAITRAESQLYVTHANTRIVNGQFLTRTVSPFLAPFVDKPH